MLGGYLYEKLIEFLGNGSRFGVKIAYVIEEEPLGTGGALKNAEHILKVEDMFIVVNGDIITNLNPLRLLEALNSRDNVIAAMAAVPLRSPYGILDIDEDGYINAFIEKPLLKDYWINGGVYAMKPAILEYLPERGDIERSTFPKLAQEKRMVALRYEEVFWRSIDTYKDVEEASKELEEMQLL